MIYHLLNKRLPLYRRVEVDDAMGGVDSQFLQVARVRCRIMLPAARERARAQADGAELNHVAHFAPKADVRRGDELRDGDQRWRVVAAAAPSAGDFWRAEVQLIQPEPTGEP